MDDIIKKIEDRIKSHQIDAEYDYFLFHRNRYSDLFKRLDGMKNQGAKLLDIGSYAGHVLIGAKEIGYDAYGCDMEKYCDMYKIRFQSLGIANRACNFPQDKIPFEENYFDLVVLSEVIEHYNFHPFCVIEDIKRVLKPGGTVLITTPNQARLNNRIRAVLGKSIYWDIATGFNDMAHYREYIRQELESLLKENNFKNIKTEYVYIDYPDANFLVKIINKFLGFFIKPLKSNIIISGEK